METDTSKVALRKESVDRNNIRYTASARPSVALRKESVDRNKLHVMFLFFFYKSLSARRAWIEIIMFVNLRVVDCVALRKESVDRNYYADRDADWVRVSLSARRAWIEIVLLVNGGGLLRSLSARRAWIEMTQCRL